MFCPTCGKDNSLELRFCASCGTNLEAVSQALTGTEEGFFTKIDTGMDQFIARYSDHVFNNSQPSHPEHSVVKSWKLLGQGVITSLLDLLLFILMWNFLPLRFLILLISTPFRLLAERSNDRDADRSTAEEDYKSPELNETVLRHRLSEAIPSVTENTTVNLDISAKSTKERVPITDRLE